MTAREALGGGGRKLGSALARVRTLTRIVPVVSRRNRSEEPLTEELRETESLWSSDALGETLRVPWEEEEGENRGWGGGGGGANPARAQHGEGAGEINRDCESCG